MRAGHRLSRRHLRSCRDARSDRDLPAVNEGDYLAVLSAGAYGFSMASNYNSRPLAAEVLVDGKEAYLVRERQSLEDLIRGEHVPLDRKETA